MVTTRSTPQGFRSTSPLTLRTKEASSSPTQSRKRKTSPTSPISPDSKRARNGSIETVPIGLLSSNVQVEAPASGIAPSLELTVSLDQPLESEQNGEPTILEGGNLSSASIQPTTSVTSAVAESHGNTGAKTLKTEPARTSSTTLTEPTKQVVAGRLTVPFSELVTSAAQPRSAINQAGLSEAVHGASNTHIRFDAVDTDTREVHMPEPTPMPEEASQLDLDTLSNSDDDAPEELKTKDFIKQRRIAYAAKRSKKSISKLRNSSQPHSSSIDSNVGVTEASGKGPSARVSSGSTQGAVQSDLVSAMSRPPVPTALDITSNNASKTTPTGITLDKKRREELAKQREPVSFASSVRLAPKSKGSQASYRGRILYSRKRSEIRWGGRSSFLKSVRAR